MTALPGLLTGCGPTARTSGASTGPRVDVSAFGARGDGVADDAQAVKDALKAGAAAGRAVYFPSGIYRVGHLTLPAGVVVVGASMDTTWLMGAIETSSGVRLSNMKLGIDGETSSFTNGASGVRFQRASFVGGGGSSDAAVITFEWGKRAGGVVFSRCVIGTNAGRGNGVSVISNGYPGATFHDILWDHCLFRSSQRMSFECIQRADGVHPMTSGYRRIDLRDCTFAAAGSECISYDGTPDCGWSAVNGCTIEGAGASTFYPWGQGVEFNTVTHMTFSGNTVYRCRGAMINSSGLPDVTSSTTYSDNVLDATVSHIPLPMDDTASAIEMNGVSEATFVNNVVRSDTGGPMLYAARSTANSFRGNTFTDIRSSGAARQCLFLANGSSQNTFRGNGFVSASTDGLVTIREASQDNRFVGNAFTGSSGRLFDLQSGIRVYQQGNDVSGG